jgi:hypothetical protein
MDFVSPRPSRAVIGLTRTLLTWILQTRHVIEVEYRREDLECLGALREQRVLLLPNHPTSCDPAIIYHLSKTVNQPFYFLCAREVFDRGLGCWGWLIRRCGAYSIVRGTADRRSFKMTRELLARPTVRLVIFPEGEVYSQNDSLLPFHSGVTQLAFWAQADLLRGGVEESIHIVPVALKYRFVEDMQVPILMALRRLESALGLPHNSADEPYPRLRRIGETVVGKLEAEYGLARSDQPPLAGRMDALKEAIVGRVAHALGVQTPSTDLPQRMRFLINALHRVTDEAPGDQCLYDRRLRDDDRRRARPLLRDLDRLANWIAVYDGYVAAHPTPERMADTIRRLEVEVLGRTYCIGKQRCVVHVGEPLTIADYQEQYAASKSETVDSLTRKLEQSIRSMLCEMG